MTSCHEQVPCFRSSSKYQEWGIVSKEWINRCTHSSCGYPEPCHCSSQLFRWSRGSKIPLYLCLLRGPSSSLNCAHNVVATQLHRDRVLRWFLHHLADVDCSATSKSGILWPSGTVSSTFAIKVLTACMFDRVGYSMDSAPIQQTQAMAAHLRVLVSYPPCCQSSQVSSEPSSELWTLRQLIEPVAVGLI